ncbi:hypothetical protein A2801_02215 [Candidatus Woesebacteria bacterium RIFCSPHIGHO2_01_FULL_41_10]|uniref:DUF1648 domain-containing protein n=1 Tax=Candidatus Woesebacteria bacterium RIFCSPHIGHO2_01_FULL_41_10 TaxID=1802500 RepID=A0A1F7YS42_9BACT|nr:MAG: hypothetical protein A2801_02215 [Candidatus Woesebacteria bacterium RIFCSPHIGHO2_01_FULL_41_10]
MKSQKISQLLEVIPFPLLIISVFVLNGGIIGAVLLWQDRLPPMIPLLYGQPRGAAQLAPRIALVIPPIIAQIVLFVNIAVSTIMNDEFVQKVLVSFAILGSIFALITVVKIFSIVGSF